MFCTTCVAAKRPASYSSPISGYCDGCGFALQESGDRFYSSEVGMLMARVDLHQSNRDPLARLAAAARMARRPRS